MVDNETAIENKPTAGIKGKRRLERAVVKGDKYDFIVKSGIYERKHWERIMELVSDVRVVRTSHVASYLGVSPGWASEMLSEMYKKHFLYRSFPKVDMGSSEGYYFIDNMGAFYLAALAEIPKKDFPWQPKDNLVGIDKLTHTISITDLRIALERKIMMNDGVALDKFWGERKTGRRQFEFDGEEHGINPDAEVGIFYRDEGVNKTYIKRFFFEYDRGTEELIKIKDKLNKYIKYYASDEFKERYKIPPILVVICDGDLSKKRFEVAISEIKDELKFDIYLSTYEEFIKNSLGEIFENKRLDSITKLVPIDAE